MVNPEVKSEKSDNPEKLPEEVIKEIESFNKKSGEFLSTSITNERIEILLVKAGVKPSGDVKV